MSDQPSHDLALWCPVCRAAELDRAVDRLTCPACGAGFEVLAGIADLRDPDIDFDVAADRDLALALHEAGPRSDFESLLRQYWLATGVVRPELVERFVRGDLVGAGRAEVVADQIFTMVGDVVLDGARVIEIGGGTAALGSEMARRGALVVGTDVSLAWLVLARRRLADAGRGGVELVACTADRLPFAADVFDLVVAADVIEHVPDPDGLVVEAHRVLRPGGALWLSTPNRFSLTPEPHVGLPGVGFLPRPLALRYVRRFRGVDYRDIRTLSSRALRRTLARGGAVVLAAPTIPGPVQAGYGVGGRLLISAYNRLAANRVTRRGLLAVTPLFHATMHKPGPLVVGAVVDGPHG